MTEPWTHKPVLPAEVLSPMLLQAQATLCWFLPSQGKQWAESSFPGPSHPGLFRRWSFPSPLPKQAGRLCPPLAPSRLTEQSCGRDWQPSSPPPAWFLPDFFLVRAGTPRCTPRYYIALVSVCVRACVRACVPVYVCVRACGPFEGAALHLAFEGRCCVTGEGVLLFGATLVCSAPGMVQGAFPTPTTPCPAPPLPCTHRLVGEAALEGREQQQTGGLLSALTGPRLRPPKVPWVGSDERVKDAQGNTGLSCLQDPPSTLQWGET